MCCNLKQNSVFQYTYLDRKSFSSGCGPPNRPSEAITSSTCPLVSELLRWCHGNIVDCILLWPQEIFLVTYRQFWLFQGCQKITFNWGVPALERYFPLFLPISTTPSPPLDSLFIHWGGVTVFIFQLFPTTIYSEKLSPTA